MLEQDQYDSFSFKADLIKKELEECRIIAHQFDAFSQASKNWAITLWAGSIAAVLSKGNTELSVLVFVTPVIPAVFWFLDAHWRGLQRRTIYRSVMISEFINSDDFLAACRKGDLGNFKVWDPTGNQYRGDDRFRDFVARRRTSLYGEVASIYTALIITSVVIGVVVRYLGA